MLHQSSNRPAWILLILHFNLNVSQAKVGHDFSLHQTKKYCIIAHNIEAEQYFMYKFKLR